MYICIQLTIRQRHPYCYCTFSISDHWQSWSCLILLMFSVFLSCCVSILHFHLSFEVHNVTPSRGQKERRIVYGLCTVWPVYLFSYKQTKQNPQVTTESETCFSTEFDQCMKTVGKAVDSLTMHHSHYTDVTMHSHIKIKCSKLLFLWHVLHTVYYDAHFFIWWTVSSSLIIII